MSRLGFALPAALCVACTAPPQPPQPRSATTVSATMGKTWDAVIDVFGEHNIPIKNMERVSGFISTDPLRGTVRDTANADCGKMLGTKVPPVLATYNVIVRGDSSTSTVRVNIRWTAGSPDPNAPARSVTVCSSTGVWESTFESRVKAIAESKL